jgi:hypothetical protein
MKRTTRVLPPWLVGGLLVYLALARPTQAAGPAPDADEFFEMRVRPVLVQHCYRCHSTAAGKSKGGLRLDSHAGLMQGGDSGPALVPGDPDASRLIRAVRQTDKRLRMPPRGKLSETQIADLTAWVKRGAPDPRVTDAAVVRSAGKPGMSLEDGRRFWSLRPVKDPSVPAVKDTSWPRTPVDRFIRARLEAAGVAPAPVADRRTLLRRVTFDLTGLPPTPAAMDAFLADRSPEAFARVVDRLLASERYGERWGRHWLDVVRYADTCGNASDHPVPQAHKYRDWVIRAFQRDLPYDEFLREQVAGDLMPARSDAERRDRITATGYLAVARRFGGDRTGEHYLTLDDTIDNLGRAFLGETLACARCHDHKFDPFTVRDYYGLYGIFASTRYPFPGAEVGKQQEDFVPLASPAEVEAALRPHREKLAALSARVKQLEAAEAEARKSSAGPGKEARLRAAAEALAGARKELAAVQAAKPVIDDAYAVADGKPADARVQVRGDPHRLGDPVPRGFPAVLGGQRLPPGFHGSGRLQLATWLTDRGNPLTARVMVNRIWQYHFGRGIVETPNDFGSRGKRPTHPELLDFLAARLIDSGWSVKAMHRLILLSRTWQLAGTAPASAVAADPNNALFGRFARQRLDAESIRDALLFVAGELEERQGGGHPFPPQSTWGFTQHVPFMAVYETRRRSVYLMQPRLRKHPYLALFDGAEPSSSTAVRLPSTTPLQALFLMNDPLAHEVAAHFADRVTAAAPDVPARLAFAYRVAFGRPPTAEEQHDCAGFLREYRDRLVALHTPADRLERLAWAAFARALLGANEFIFID